MLKESLFTIFLSFVVLCDAPLCSAKVVRAEQWKRFETVLKGPNTGNPFKDVSLTAKFYGERGDTVSVTGFYDGDGTYVIRFMPTKTGEWHYRTFSNIASMNGKTGSLVCTEPLEGNHGPVKVKGLHAFEYSDGTPYYPVGTTAYAWIHMPDSLQEQTLYSLKVASFDKVRMCVFPKTTERVKEEPEVYPFEVSAVSASGKREFDFSRFNPEFFRRLEQRIEDLDEIGVEADLILFHPYDKGRWGFDSMPMETNLAYISYITARLSSFKNIWWSLANEYDYVKARNEDEWKRMILCISENDPYKHLCSIHGSTATYFPYESMDEITHTSIQDEAPVEDFGRAATVRNIFRKPVIFDEVCYEGNLSSRWGRLSGQEMLHRICLGLIAGTYVTHGECYEEKEGGFDDIFWAKGGKWRGESWKRIAFVRNILDSLPAPLQLADVSRDHKTSTAGDGYYLIYFGESISDSWLFNLPNKNAAYSRVKAGTKYKVEIIDLWNMSVTEYPEVFEAGETIDYRHYDVDFKKVRLPKIPYLLLRVRAI